jgi:hypothetical protein
LRGLARWRAGKAGRLQEEAEASKDQGAKRGPGVFTKE